eukprot:13853231-Alexandrium_andersonii.AAC.1
MQGRSYTLCLQDKHADCNARAARERRHSVLAWGDGMPIACPPEGPPARLGPLSVAPACEAA